MVEIIKQKNVTTIISGKKGKSPYYVSPEELRIGFSKSIDNNNCTVKFLLLFQKIITGYSVAKMYKANKIDVNASINYAITEAYLKWDKYNEERSGNIFSFYNTMLINDFLIHYKYITKGKKTSISIESLFVSKNKN